MSLIVRGNLENGIECKSGDIGLLLMFGSMLGRYPCI